MEIILEVIVLNKQFQYVRETTWKKVLKWLAKDKIEIILERSDKEIIGAEIRIKMPVVVRLLDFVGYKIKRDTNRYSPQAVYERDKNICQYWHFDSNGKRFKYECSESDRSIDHIVPQYLDGKNSFTNCVCCCKKHNYKKGKKSVKDAGLELIKKPQIPANRKGDFAVFKFKFNPDKISHRYYVEKFLQSSLTR